jgi:hypothetical protein
MIRSFKKALAVSLVLAALSSQPAYSAEKAKKVPKIKLETLKPGKIKLDDRLGYVMIRLGPKAADKNPALGVGFSRIDAATNKPFDFPTIDVIPKDFWRTASVGINVGRSFADVDGAGLYYIGFYPGRWVIGGVGQTCMSLGTYTFDVKQGEVTDIGTLLVARENGEAGVPELKDAKLSQDLAEFGTMMNIVMTEALYAKPASDTPTLPAELKAWPVTKATLMPDHRFDNNCTTLINRASSLPPLGHQPPMTRDEAVMALAKMNPPERVEAARKRAERAKAAAAAKKQ